MINLSKTDADLEKLVNIDEVLNEIFELLNRFAYNIHTLRTLRLAPTYVAGHRKRNSGSAECYCTSGELDNDNSNDGSGVDEISIISTNKGTTWRLTEIFLVLTKLKL